MGDKGMPGSIIAIYDMIAGLQRMIGYLVDRVNKLNERMNSDRCDLTRKIEALEMRVNKLEHANQQEQCDHVWDDMHPPGYGVHCLICGKKVQMYEEKDNAIYIAGHPIENYQKYDLAQIIKRLSEQLENIWNQ